MKKLILLFALAFAMCGCRYTSTGPNIRMASNPVIVVDKNTLDSCEYYPSYGHKGNCKYCAERRRNETEELIKRNQGTMTREEEIHNAAMEVSKRWRREEQPTQDEIIAYDAAVTMAKWADSHPREGLVDIEKACTYLESVFKQLAGYYSGAEYTDAFRKAMED
jgi:hypothetical protein